MVPPTTGPRAITQSLPPPPSSTEARQLTTLSPSLATHSPFLPCLLPGFGPLPPTAWAAGLPQPLTGLLPPHSAPSGTFLKHTFDRIIPLIKILSPLATRGRHLTKDRECAHTGAVKTSTLVSCSQSCWLHSVVMRLGERGVSEGAKHRAGPSKYL